MSSSVKTKPEFYTDEHLLACLRRAAEICGEPLSGVCYQELAATERLAAYATITRRLGSWQEACKRAGVKYNPARGPSPHAITPEQCWEAIRQCAKDLRHRPSYAQYSEWAKGRNVPKGPTVRSKHNGSWTQAVSKALEIQPGGVIWGVL